MIYIFILVALFALSLYGVVLGLGYVTVPMRLSRRQWTVVLSLALFVLTLEATEAWMIFRTPTPQAALQRSLSYTAASVVAAFMQVTTSFPVDINDLMKLETIDSKANRLVYVMSIDARDSSSFLRIVNGVRADVLQNGCQRADYRTLMRFNLGVEFDFKVIRAWGAEPIILTPDMCGF